MVSLNRDDNSTLNMPEERVLYAYDGLGRVVSIDDSQFASPTTQAYDIEGRLIKLDSPQGYLNYGYDDLGRLTRTWTCIAANGADAITDTHYDYDRLGRLTSVTVKERNNSGPNSLNETTEYAYDKNGNLDFEIRPGEVVTDYVYDALNRLDLLENFIDADHDGHYDPGETLLGRYDYELASDGKRTRVIETDDQGNTTTIDWIYDELGRLIEERDDFDDLTDVHDDEFDYIARYGFDLVSNRIQLAKDLENVNAAAFSADETTLYEYDQNDRLLSEALNYDSDPETDRTTVYQYGATNNRTEQTEKTIWQGSDTDPQTGVKVSTTTYAYDVRGRLGSVAIDSDGNGVANQTFTYQYNDDGIRISSTDSITSLTTIHHVDPNNPTGFAQVLEEGTDGGTPDGRLQAAEIAKSYTLGLDVIAQATSSSANLFLLYDGHGSTRAVANAVGGIQQRYAYDAYGNMLAGTGLAGSVATALLYSGEKTDLTGLQYLRARYYDPTSGRFASRRLVGDRGVASRPMPDIECRELADWPVSET